MIPQALSSRGVSALINICAIILLTANLVQNYFVFHNHAIAGISSLATPSDLPSDFPHEQIISSLNTLDDHLPIGVTIPKGGAVALPSVRISDEEESSINRKIYGGKGDKPHLGGFTEFDPLGVSPSFWKHMVTQYGIKSLLDVGCGRGISTSWFISHDLEYVQCVEGSHDAVTQAIIPESSIVEHDFSRGPWWPDRTVDAVWCVEFTEHVGRNFQPNYLTAFRKAALIFVTHSNWGGWHHVEVHNDDWWRVRFEAAGLVYSEYLTMEAREIAKRDQSLKNLTLDMKPDLLYFVGQHIYLNLQVFINPMVASLPQHAHLFAEHGCYGGRYEQKNFIHVECGTEKKAAGDYLTPLPESFKPIKLTPEMDNKWFELIKDFKTNGRKPQ